MSAEPKWVVHPGEMLQEELDERGITQTELAYRSGWTLKHINTVIKGHANLSIPFALMLETELGVSARFWLNLQLAYDLGRARGYPEPAQ